MKMWLALGGTILDTAAPGSVGLPSSLTALRHHFWPILITFLVALGLGWAYTAATNSSYTSESVVLVSPVPGNPLTAETASASNAQLSVAMETEAGIVSTPAIADLASTAIGRSVPGDGERLRVDVPSGTQTVRIAFSSDSPEAGQEGAQAFADAYLQYRGERAESSQTARLDQLQSQAESADENLRRAIGEASDSDEATYAGQEVQLYADRLAQVNENISSATVVSTDPGRVLNPARSPDSEDGISEYLIWIVAGLLGLLLGGLIAIVREWRADLVRENESMEVLGVPVFATINPEDKAPAFFGEDQSVNREQYRRLRSGVVANGPRPHVISVAAVDATEHATTVSANLAVALAEAGFSVLAISADPYDPGMENLFNIASSPGLSDVVMAEISPQDAFGRAGDVTVLPAGSNPEGAREMYAGPAFANLVSQVRKDFDYVVMAAAGASTADGDAVIGAADSVLLVLTSSRTTHAQVGAALERFQRLGIATIGAVLAPRATPPKQKRDHSDKNAPSTTGASGTAQPTSDSVDALT